MAKEKKEKISYITGRPKTPNLHILKHPDGRFTIDYGQDDDFARAKTYKEADLDKEIQKLFGYESWEEYKEKNSEDLRRTRKEPTESGKLHVPTLFPFHVAYALEEFEATFKPEEYEVVGVPIGDLPFLTIEGDKSWWQIFQAVSTPAQIKAKWLEMGEDIADYYQLDPAYRLKGLFATNEENDRARASLEAAKEAVKADAKRRADEKRMKIEAEFAARMADITKEDFGVDEDTRKKIEVVRKLREAFFGADDVSGILKRAMYDPAEILSNSKEVIGRVEDQFKFKVKDHLLEQNFPVSHPAGDFWHADFEPSLLKHYFNKLREATGSTEPGSSIYSTDSKSDAFTINASQLSAKTAMLSENKLLLEVAGPFRRFMDAWITRAPRLGASPAFIGRIRNVENIDELHALGREYGIPTPAPGRRISGVVLDDYISRVMRADYAARTSTSGLGSVTAPRPRPRRDAPTTTTPRPDAPTTTTPRPDAPTTTTPRPDPDVGPPTTTTPRSRRTPVGGETPESLPQRTSDIVADAPVEPARILDDALADPRSPLRRELANRDREMAEAIAALTKKLEGGWIARTMRFTGKTLFWGTAASLVGIYVVCSTEHCEAFWKAIYEGRWIDAVELMFKAIEEMANRAMAAVSGEEPPEEKDPAALQSDAIANVNVALEYYILPIGWRNIQFLTPGEKILADRIGANTELLGKAEAPVEAPAPGEAVAPGETPAAQSLNEVNALFFGHSQADPLSRKLRAQIKEAGGKVKFIAHGFPDSGLAEKIKSIKGKFTHAYLFLNGNSYPPKAQLHKPAKRKIIDYVQSSLGVSKDNILVILPPVNNASYEEEDLRARFKKEKKYAEQLSYKRLARNSQRRGAELNPLAREYFNSLGVKVSDPIVSTDPTDFRDGLHIRRASDLSKDFQAGEMSNLTSKFEVPPVISDEPAARDEQRISNGKEVDILQHLAEGKVTIFNFTNSQWCEPCKKLAPILEGISASPNVALRKIHINSFDDPVLAQYGVGGIPYWAIFDPAGKLVASSAAGEEDKLVDLIASDAVYPWDKVQSAVDKALEKTGRPRPSGDVYAITGEKPKVEKDYWKTSPGKRDMVNIISEEAAKAGVDRDFMLASAQVESGMDPFNSMKLDKEGKIISPLQGGEQYHGIYAVSRKWFWSHSKLTSEQKFKDYPSMVYDPRHHAKEFTRIIKRLYRSAKRFMPKTESIANIDEGEEWILYLMWQQGPTGILKSLQNDDDYKWGTHNWGQNYFGPAGWSPLGREIQKNYKQLKVEVKKYPELKGKWHKIPADNEVMAKNIELRNQITAKMFRDGWKSLYSSIKRKALRKVPKIEQDVSKMMEHRALEEIYKIIEETNNELV